MLVSASALLLLLGTAVISAQNCLELPDVPNARAVNPKASYEKGDSVSFHCETGYTSGRQIRYICSDRGWIPNTRGLCRLKPCVLPDDIPNGYYVMETGEDFVFGTTIKYICNEGYQMMSKDDTRTCFGTGWSNHLPVCEPLSCDAPPPTAGVTVEGLPSEEGPILPDRFLTFSCASPGATLNGSATLICGKDGQWDNPFPNCVEVSCALPAPNPKLRVVGPEGVVAAGDWVSVACVRGGTSRRLQCLQTGQWSATFPTCSDHCEVVNVPNSVLYSPSSKKQLLKGQSLIFRCKSHGHLLQGQGQVTCLEDGQWNHTFPSCSDPQGCGPPPPLENGDFFGSGVMFDHMSEVQYLCQDKFIMQGGPHLTCNNGAWTGHITCLKPCTINPDLMRPQNIKFKYGSKQKLYATHDDHITFECIDGFTPKGSWEMRQICKDGVMHLPECVRLQ